MHYISLPTTSKILVAEDNEANQFVIGEMLANFDLQADMVSDGKQALQAIKSQHYDLVLMDDLMPMMTGIEVVKQVRQSQDERLKRLPIIAITANGWHGERERYLNAGMNELIAKPIEIQKLFLVLAKYLQADALALPPTQPAVSTPPAADLAIFNASAMLDRLGGNRQIAQKTISKFLSTIDQSINSLDIAVKNRNVNSIELITHTIHGTTAMVGGERASELVRQLNLLAKTDNLMLFDQSMREIKLSVSELIIILNDWIARGN